MVQFVNQNPPGKYETVAASQSDQVMGPVGATGDFLEALIVMPSATTNSSVTVKDGSTTVAVIPVSGATQTYYVPFRSYSVGGAWKITTGSSVTVVAVGAFS